MAKCHSVTPAGESAGFEQRIFHSSGLLLHGGERLADLDRSHVRGAQVANFLYLKQIKESVAGGRRKQSGPFPCGQLSRVNAKYAGYVFSSVSVHSANNSAHIIESMRNIRKCKVALTGTFSGNVCNGSSASFVERLWKTWRISTTGPSEWREPNED